MIQDARHFKYSSDYPQPLVVYKNQFTISAAQDTVSLTKIEHHLPYIPLALGKWSETQDFVTAQDISTTEPIGDTPTIIMRADATYFYFVLFNNSHSAVTRYVKVAAFAPPDYEGDIEIASNDTKFRFDSDNDYLELYQQGTLTRDTGGAVYHSLGYIPQCRAWAWGNTSVGSAGIDIDGFALVDSSIIKYANTGRLEYNSIATKDKFIAYAYDADAQDYEIVGSKSKIYYHIYTKEG